MISAPLSSEYTHQLAEKLLTPIKRGESTFIRWFPGHGKTILLSQIFSDKNYLSSVLGKYFKRYIIVKIEGLFFPESDFSDYLLSILQTLTEEAEKLDLNLDSIKNPRLQYPSSTLITKKIISDCKKIVNNGNEIIFVIDSIDDFNELFLKQLFFSLEHIVDSNRERIHTHININKRHIIDEIVTQSSLIQNILTIPLPDIAECNHFINYYKQKWDINLSKENQEKIFQFCGNDLGLLKELLRLLSKSGQKEIRFISEPTLLIKSKINYLLFSKNEKDVIEEKLSTNSISPKNKRSARELMEANFWDKYFHIPVIYEQMIIEKSKIRELLFNSKIKSLFFGDIDLQKKLSVSEYNILLKLHKKFRRTVSRDEIAEILWGEKLLDLYSDWAIDKAISRLREKLSHFSFHYQIITKKKKGFLLAI